MGTSRQFAKPTSQHYESGDVPQLLEGKDAHVGTAASLGELQHDVECGEGGVFVILVMSLEITAVVYETIFEMTRLVFLGEVREGVIKYSSVVLLPDQYVLTL